MRLIFLVLLLAAAWLAGCASPPARLTKPAEIESHVGKKVTLVGEVSNSKMPEILGVDVPSADHPDLRGSMAEATGILERYEVTEEQAAEMYRSGVAHRGAGLFYRLRGETVVEATK